MAHIITFASKKGGTGKSTAAMALAGTLGARGLRVLVVDTDPQGSCVMYARAAPADKPFPAEVRAVLSPELLGYLEADMARFDFILIDTQAGTAFDATQRALVVSDLCLVPCRPSPADLWAVAEIRRLIEQAKELNPTLRAVLLPSQVSKTGIATAVLRALAEAGMPVLAAGLGNRTAFPEAMLAGKPVQWQGPAARAAVAEVEQLTNEILKLLETP